MGIFHVSHGSPDFASVTENPAKSQSGYVDFIFFTNSEVTKEITDILEGLFMALISVSAKTASFFFSK